MIRTKVLNLDTKTSLWFLQFYKYHTINIGMRIISRSGDYGMIWLVFISLVTLFPHGQRIAQRMLFALLLATILGQVVLKYWFSRKRPCQKNPTVDLLIVRPSDSSFPSGHTTSSFACATVICYYSFVLGSFAVLFAIIMAISRLYLYVHYLSDVVFGILLGVLIGICIMMF